MRDSISKPIILKLLITTKSHQIEPLNKTIVFLKNQKLSLTFLAIMQKTYRTLTMMNQLRIRSILLRFSSKITLPNNLFYK